MAEDVHEQLAMEHDRHVQCALRTLYMINIWSRFEAQILLIAQTMARHSFSMVDYVLPATVSVQLAYSTKVQWWGMHLFLCPETSIVRTKVSVYLGYFRSGGAIKSCLRDSKAFFSFCHWAFSPSLVRTVSCHALSAKLGTMCQLKLVSPFVVGVNQLAAWPFLCRNHPVLRKLES